MARHCLAQENTMKKQRSKTSRPCARSSSRAQRTVRRPAIDRTPPDPLESALAAAARLAEPYPEEATSVDNVIRFVRDHRHGQPAQVRLSDVLLALSLILGATDRKLTPEERDMLAVLEFSLGTSARAGTVCVPGAAARLPVEIATRRCARRASRRVPTSFTSLPYVRLTA
jgi:hypothetical protein